MDLAHYFQESTQHIEDEPQVTSIIHAVAALLACPACPATASLHTSPHDDIFRVLAVPTPLTWATVLTAATRQGDSGRADGELFVERQADGTREVSAQHSPDDDAKKGGNDAPVEAWHELKSPVDFSKTVGRIRVQTQSATLTVSATPRAQDGRCPCCASGCAPSLLNDVGDEAVEVAGWYQKLLGDGSVAKRVAVVWRSISRSSSGGGR